MRFRLLGAVQSIAAPDSRVNVAAKAIENGTIGATMEPRWPGSNDLVPTLGKARVDWAYGLDLPRGTSIRHARVSGIGPVLVQLSDGTCVSLDPRIVGSATSLSIARVNCHGDDSTLMFPSDVRAHRVVRSKNGDFVANVDRKRGQTILFYKGSGSSERKVLTVPFLITLIGSLPDPHGAAFGITLLGYRSGKPIIIGLTATKQNLLSDS